MSFCVASGANTNLTIIAYITTLSAFTNLTLNQCDATLHLMIILQCNTTDDDGAQRLRVSDSLAFRRRSTSVGGASALVTFICCALLLRWCECSRDFHLCGLFVLLLSSCECSRERSLAFSALFARTSHDAYATLHTADCSASAQTWKVQYSVQRAAKSSPICASSQCRLR
jgi:hypothetical protein